jgi:hypothetical protein
LISIGTVSQARANLTGNRLLWVFEPSFSNHQIYDSAGGPMLFQINSPGFIAPASDRLARRWAFVPTSDTPVTVTDEDGTPFGAPFNARANETTSAMMSADGTKLIVGSFDLILGQPAYRVYDLTPLESGGAPGDLGVAPIVAGVLERGELLNNLFLTPHEGEVVACSRLRIGATALP